MSKFKVERVSELKSDSNNAVGDYVDNCVNQEFVPNKYNLTNKTVKFNGVEHDTKVQMDEECVSIGTGSNEKLKDPLSCKIYNLLKIVIITGVILFLMFHYLFHLQK